MRASITLPAANIGSVPTDAALAADRISAGPLINAIYSPRCLENALSLSNLLQWPSGLQMLGRGGDATLRKRPKKC